MRLERHSGVGQCSGIWTPKLEVPGPRKTFKQWCHGQSCALSAHSDGSEGKGWSLGRQETLSALVQPTGFEGIIQGRGRGNIKEDMESSNAECYLRNNMTQRLIRRGCH